MQCMHLSSAYIFAPRSPSITQTCVHKCMPNTYHARDASAVSLRTDYKQHTWRSHYVTRWSVCNGHMQNVSQHWSSKQKWSVHYYPVGFSVCWWDEVRHDIAILHATKGHILGWWLRKYLTYNSHHQTGNMTSAPLVGIRSWHSVSSISIYSFVHIHF